MLTKHDRTVGVMVKDIAIGAGGRWFDSRRDQIGHCRQRSARYRYDFSLLSQRYAAKLGLTTRYEFLRNTASILKI